MQAPLKEHRLCLSYALPHSLDKDVALNECSVRSPLLLAHPFLISQLYLCLSLYFFAISFYSCFRRNRSRLIHSVLLRLVVGLKAVEPRGPNETPGLLHRNKASVLSIGRLTARDPLNRILNFHEEKSLARRHLFRDFLCADSTRREVTRRSVRFTVSRENERFTPSNEAFSPNHLSLSLLSLSFSHSLLFTQADVSIKSEYHWNFHWLLVPLSTSFQVQFLESRRRTNRATLMVPYCLFRFLILFPSFFL